MTISVPVHMLVFPLRVKYNGEVVVVNNEDELASIVSKIHDLEIDNCSSLNEMVKMRGSRLSGQLKRYWITDFDDFVEQTGGILPMLRGFGARTLAMIRRVKPDLRMTKELKYPVRYELDSVVSTVRTIYKLDDIILDAYHNHKTFKLVSEGCELLIDDKYPAVITSAFMSKGITDVDAFLNFSGEIVPYLRNIGPKRVKEMKKYHNNVVYAPSLSYPIFYTLGDSDEVLKARSASALSDVLVESYKSGVKVKVLRTGETSGK